MTHVSLCAKTQPRRPLPRVTAASVVYQADMAATLRRQVPHPGDILVAVREQKEVNLRMALQSSVQRREKGLLAITLMGLGKVPSGVIILVQVWRRELLGSPLLKRGHIVADCERSSPFLAERSVGIPENSLSQGDENTICQAG